MPYKDPQQQKEAIALWQKNNKERVNAKSRRWKLRNAEHCKQYSKQQKSANRGYYTGLQAARRAAQYNATPPWVDKAALTAVYASATPGYEVDHIVPLLGTNVCGLHVPWNLQVIPMHDNRKKSNRWQ